MFKNFITSTSIQGNNYIPRQKLGEGRNSAVYKSYHINDADQKNPLAIKFPTLCATSAQRTKLIEQQAHILQELTCPYTPQYIDHSTHNINPYLVLEYIPQTLSDKVDNNTITQTLLLEYLQQIPLILSYFEHKNKVPGDLKCANLGYKDHYLKVLDVESIQPPGQYTKPKETLSSHPPEFRDQGLITPTFDEYTAGKNIEYLLTGENNENAQETFQTIELYHDIVLPESFQQLYLAMTHPNHTQRATPSQIQALALICSEELQQKEYFKTESFSTLEL